MRSFTRASITASVLFMLLFSAQARAQFGGLGGSKKTSNVDGAIAAGTDLLGYITIATGLGNQAAGQLVDMYPPEKTEGIRKLAAQQAELKAKSKDGNIDADQMKVSTELQAEVAKLEKDEAWKGYKKEKAGNVSKAYSALGLMALADGVAGTKVKPTLDGLQAAAKDIGKDPMQAAKLQTINGQIASLTAIAPALPKQVESANAVRSICSKIATAEKVTLPTDVQAEKVKDLSTLKASATSIEG